MATFSLLLSDSLRFRVKTPTIRDHSLFIAWREGDRGFWLCHDKIYLFPYKALQYSNDPPPSLAVNKQLVSTVPPLYAADDHN